MVGDACRKRGKTLGVGGINDDEDARRYIAVGLALHYLGQRSQFHCGGSIERADFYRKLAAEAGDGGKPKGGRKSAERL
jgi:hypothetical protein